ncbi:acyl-CoA dehydrogenase family protein [Aquibaculum arenosum]|uniref:Acyl-CoA dehydrogenase family protein n=1 Tax=Aquibaculum arenosum TaxID=3032591 RepID=A0ABT5YPZ8_9PROT|nr:acyl-CoA dehydrogenase family protein [Fodinicurvata sp. CAU 1616]MDF2097050.1 acyl-CoA dehydrogenase family protein [Fodinicurvata sp. CAU 1616]
MLLSEEQEMIRETARTFAHDRLAPFAAEWDRESRFPAEALQEMAALGFMGMTVPEAWDGAGADTLSYAAALMEIAAGDGSCSTIMSVHNSVGCLPVLRFGSEEQKERFLKPMARGEALTAFCLTEPQAGSDAAAIKTRARREGNKWILNGTKQFITSGRNAKLAIVFAVTDPEKGRKGISAFIVPTDSPGWKVAGVEKKLGQRASDTCQIVFEDLELTPDLMLGEEGEGYRIALANLEGGRIGIAAQSVGMARAAYEHACSYARERESFGKRIVEHQAVGFRLADMATKIHAAELMTLHAAALKDAGKPCLREAAMAKLHASEIAEEVCSAAIQVFGGYGYLEDFPVERIYRDVRVCQIYEGTSDIQRLIIARQIAAE